MRREGCPLEAPLQEHLHGKRSRILQMDHVEYAVRQQTSPYIRNIMMMPAAGFKSTKSTTKLFKMSEGCRETC